MSSFANLSLILIFFTAGYFTNRLVDLPAIVPQRINKAVIYFIFPAIILLNIPSLELQKDSIFLVVAPWLVIGTSAAVLLLLNIRYRWDSSILCACLILAGLGNTGNLGFPMLKTFFSDEQASLGIIFDQLGTFIALCTYASILIGVFGSGGKVAPLALIKRIFLFPPFVTLLVAFVLPPDLIQGVLRTLLTYMSYTIIPLTMFGIGMQFRFSANSDAMVPLVWALGLKMLVAPVVVLVAGKLVGIPEYMLEVAIFQAAMPPVVAGVVLLISQGLATRFSVSALGFGTLIALAYLPLLAWVLNLT